MAKPKYELAGKTVFITGPARGIGAEAARQLAAKGAKIALVGLEPELLEQRAAELPTETFVFEADVRDLDALETAAKETAAKLGGIDVVIANAGIATPGAVADIDPQVFEDTINVNLLGVWKTNRATLPFITESNGYILNIASVAAALHPPMIAHYAASKAGVEAFSDALRTEMIGTGVDVGVAYFSFLDTDMVRNGREKVFEEGLPDQPAFIDKVYPVENGVRAVVRGIERRSRRIVYPKGFMLPVMVSPPMQNLMDAGVKFQQRKR